MTFKNFIGGEWVAARSGVTFETRNPADTNEVVGTFQKSDADDTRQAIAAAKAAQPAWAAMPAPKRGEVLYKAANILESRADQVAREMTREEGKTLPGGAGRSRPRHQHPSVTSAAKARVSAATTFPPSATASSSRPGVGRLASSG